jgi:signal peptidase II
MLACAALTLALDQATKRAVLLWLPPAEDVTVIEGFFRFVHWGNTGAAWSLFRDNNTTLAVVSAVALVLLFFARKQFTDGSPAGNAALGLMFGGILGNLVDRIWIGHVVDFIYFHVLTRSGREAGFPAFNIADSAICIGVAILFMRSWNAPPEGDATAADTTIAPDTAEASHAPGNPGDAPQA